jgi:hypothetical protein
MRPGWVVLCAGMALALCASAARAQGEPAVVKRATELREAPGESARSLGPLTAESAVTRLGERQGPWIQVRSNAGTTGWVHMFDVGAATAPASNAATGSLRSLTNLFNKGGSGQRGATTPTSTIGIRGLGAEDIAQAQPNPAAVTQMENLRQNEGQAREFARDAALSSASVPALAAPARVRAPSATPGNPEQMP